VASFSSALNQGIEQREREIVNKLLHWITGFLPCRIIKEGNRPYLERYYLFTVLGTTFYLHRFVSSDPDRGLHDHPWRWAYSIILSGFYFEQTRYAGMAEIRKVKWFNRLTGDSFHRVVLPMRTEWIGADKSIEVAYDIPCWTLFFHQSEKSKIWGFLRHAGQLGWLYTPYAYGDNELGKDEAWWLKAPRGKETERAQA
jgi:hypothetical protein